VTADRGYGKARVDDDLRDIGVTTVAIPLERANPARPAGPPNTAPASAGSSSENRQRRPHQPPKTPLRLGTQPRRRPRPHRRVVRTGLAHNLVKITAVAAG
jgi:hypothetical protein